MLVNQLRNPETKVQISVLGALRNLSFGRANDDNKLEIAGEHGLAEILLALKMSRVVEVRDLLTSLLWNLSSCEVSRWVSHTHTHTHKKKANTPLQPCAHTHAH